MLNDESLNKNSYSINETSDGGLKLFLLLLGSKAPDRNVEQHDYFFGIARNIIELIPHLKAFWPEAGDSLHIDAWREVSVVDNYKIHVALKEEISATNTKKLFFINLGGYQSGKLEEQHYTMLLVQDDKPLAIKESKKTIFFKTNTVKGANSHIDEQYGVDVDDVFTIEEILPPAFKEKYQIIITENTSLLPDEIHLGYLKLSKLSKQL